MRFSMHTYKLLEKQRRVRKACWISVYKSDMGKSGMVPNSFWPFLQRLFMFKITSPTLNSFALVIALRRKNRHTLYLFSMSKARANKSSLVAWMFCNSFHNCLFKSFYIFKQFWRRRVRQYYSKTRDHEGTQNTKLLQRHWHISIMSEHLKQKQKLMVPLSPSTVATAARANSDSGTRVPTQARTWLKMGNKKLYQAFQSTPESLPLPMNARPGDYTTASLHGLARSIFIFKQMRWRRNRQYHSQITWSWGNPKYQINSYSTGILPSCRSIPHKIWWSRCHPRL